MGSALYSRSSAALCYIRAERRVPKKRMLGAEIVFANVCQCLARVVDHSRLIARLGKPFP